MLDKALGTGWDEAKGTIEFDPNNVQISKAEMLPSWENLKTLGGNLKEGWETLAEPGMDKFDIWEGAQFQPLGPKGTRGVRIASIPSEESLMMGDIDAGYGLTPREGIMQAGTPFVDDYNYPQRQTMAANWNELDDYEAQTAALQPSEYGVGQVEEDPAETWWSNLGKKITPGNIAKGIGSFVTNKAMPWAGMAIHPLMMGFGALRGGMGNLANTMRGGLTQRGYEQARNQRRTASRVENMLARKEAGDPYSQKNLNILTMGSRPGHYDVPGGGEGGQGGGAQPGSMPTGTAGQNPWGRARGGLAGLWRR